MSLKDICRAGNIKYRGNNVSEVSGIFNSVYLSTDFCSGRNGPDDVTADACEHGGNVLLNAPPKKQKGMKVTLFFPRLFSSFHEKSLNIENPDVNVFPDSRK